jgi:hypothetical protein
MKKTVETGDLVRLFRRNRQGVGLITRCTEDVVKEMSSPDLLHLLLESREHGHTWQERNIAISKFLEESGLPMELAQAFLRYNSFHAYRPLKIEKPVSLKVSFAHVRWLKRPSEYTHTQIMRDFGWYPIEWLKKVE